MQKKGEKLLWWDIDEALVSSMYSQSDSHSSQLIDLYGQHWEGHKYSTSSGVGWDAANERYVTFVRPWAREAIAWSYETFGRENVKVLTQGTADYIFKMLRVTGLDFHEKSVFTRENIEYPKHNFDKFNNVLVDNETYIYHTEDKFNKVDFLSGISPDKYVQVKHFDVRYFLPEHDLGYLEEVKQNIIKAFG
jgi:hypothetical protein